MNIDEYISHDAVALADLVDRREVTATELLRLARRRMGAVNPLLNAVVREIAAPASARAAATDLHGPFAGVPFLLKDLGQEYIGQPCSHGSRSMATVIATENADVTRRFLDCGLVIVGHTNTPELGAKAVTEPEYWGPARNPWNTRHTPGGSSGGSGAAVAAGIVPAAGANDGGGSIRIPAACNGLVGLKTSRGLIPDGSRTGATCFGMVAQGVLSRTVRDSAGLYDALVGDHTAASDQTARPNNPFIKQIDDAPPKLRVGYTYTSAINPSPHPEAITAVENTARLLTDLGHFVEPVEPPYDDAALARDFLVVWFASLHHQVSSIKERFGTRNHDFEADTLAAAELGRTAGLDALTRALSKVNDHIRLLTAFHACHDVLVTPTLAAPPPVVGANTTPLALRGLARLAAGVRGGKALIRTGILDQLVHDNLSWVPYTQIANLTGHPAISVPMHWTETGLPLGVQFLGRWGADGDLLRIAAQLERAQPWVHRYPTSVRRAARTAGRVDG